MMADRVEELEDELTVLKKEIKETLTGISWGISPIRLRAVPTAKPTPWR